MTNHYIAVNITAGQKATLGHIYAPSRKRAQEWLDSNNYSDARALLFSSQSPKEKRKKYPILFGKPTNNDRGAGRKSTGLRRSVTICGLTQQEADHLDSQPNKGLYIASLIKNALLNKEEENNVGL